MRLEPLLRSELTFVFEDVRDRDEVLARLAKAASKSAPSLDSGAILRALIQREEQTPTATEEGVAFPHAMLPNVNETLLLIAKVTPPVSFGDSDTSPDLIFCMIGSSDKPWEHVRLLARLARISRGAGALDRLRDADSPDELLKRFIDEDRSHG